MEVKLFFAPIKLLLAMVVGLAIPVAQAQTIPTTEELERNFATIDSLIEEMSELQAEYAAADQSNRRPIAGKFDDFNIQARREMTRLFDSLQGVEGRVRSEEQKIEQIRRTHNSAGDVQQQIHRLEEEIDALLAALNLSCRDPGQVQEGRQSQSACLLDPDATARIVVEIDFINSCNDVGATIGADRVVRLDGVVGSLEDQYLLRSLFGADAARNVAMRPPPVCEAYRVLNGPLRAGQRPAVRLMSGKTTIAFEESLAFEVKSPAYDSYLYVIYLQADGTVVNLTPRRQGVRRPVDAYQVLTFGDGREGRPKFTAQPPAGPEAIIVIASDQTIEVLEDIEDPATGQFRAPGVARSTGTRPLLGQRRFFRLLESGLPGTGIQAVSTSRIGASIAYLTIGR